MDRPLLIRFAVLALFGIVAQAAAFSKFDLTATPLYRPSSWVPTLSGSSALSLARLSKKRPTLFAKRKQSYNFGINRQNLDFTVTNTLIASNVLLFLATSLWPRLKGTLMKIDNRIARGETYRLFTALFIHGGMSHLIMNSLSLSNIGPQVERVFGPKQFATIYLGSGVLANVATFFANSAPYSLGASASTFGLLGAMGGYYYINQNILGTRSDAVLSSIKRNLLMNFMYGLSTPNVDHWAHAAGFGAGLGLSWVLTPRLASRRFLSSSAVFNPAGFSWSGKGAGFRGYSQHKPVSTSPWHIIQDFMGKLKGSTGSSRSSGDAGLGLGFGLGGGALEAFDDMYREYGDLTDESD